MLVDSHCHLDRVDLTPHGGDFAALIAATRAAGVTHLMSIGIDLEHYPAMRALIEPYPEVFCSVGVHPNENEGEDPDVARLLALADDPRVRAIGETGLDYYRGAEDAERQQRRFRTHIAAARACAKPLVIHTRQARADTLQILEEAGAGEVGGVVHCFTEDWETARRALELGFHIGFSGIVTFKNAAELREVARQVPDERLLIETDAPYLAPVPHRGKSNQPAWVAHVAECLAEVRGSTPEAIAALTRDNALRLFDLPG
ncbi:MULTISPECIES: TatD family hydrolase [Marichromatium]|uniref:Deoxyribonuclease n=1 Tax=Marichromatium gracile TaxID=1048 RepID=A0A4V6P4R1_MARGR|nr:MULTISPECIES: TatD family hydrolase [Marichromatium]KXX64825.1 deoxyribonuclease [Marichromatium gracile]MBK1708189.1 TatD family deoxyribonuclease [Marichromatium gracile]RNE89576.1 TatD family deoxyribonuclease [Marichromatium sp. AB31]RNE94655.1 TatD family deoxyribonuclease [Marichromatium sp. AB32]TCW35870.1 TatD DNase family protein [Marichromatium gracile]